MNRSVHRAIRILEYLAEAEGSLDLGVISRELAMSKSTTYRFLSALANHGYVRQDDGSRRYSLGAKTAWLAARFLDKVEVRAFARPALEDLARHTGETVHLGILDQDEVSYIDKIEGRQAMRMASRVGIRMPVHSTALGKVLLSGLPESEWRRYVAAVGLRVRTPNTIVEPEEFYKELRRVRDRGYAIDNVENEKGIRCLAAPIRAHTGRAVAALSISGWTLTMTLERAKSLVAMAQDSAQQVSLQLGFEPHAPPRPASLQYETELASQ